MTKNKTNVIADDSIETKFEIEKYWGDVTKDISTLTPITETIPMRPNSNLNDRVLFKISSNHPEEYVHLEQCELSEVNEDGILIGTETFITDGCVDPDYREYVKNSDRTQFTNEDVFNMRPFLYGCKTKWHIKCKTASCKRGLEKDNKEAFNAHCSISNTCPRNYETSFLNLDAISSRKRRSIEDTSVDEAIVETILEHPCYNVNAEQPTHCSNGVCWNLSECAAAFPKDYPNYSPTSDENAKLNTIISLLKDLFADHMNENDKNDEEKMANEIENQADFVLTAVQTAEDGIEKLKEIVTKYD